MDDCFLRLTRVTKFYDSEAAVDQVSLEVFEGELLCLLGPSGSGKTTLLRLIAGLEVPKSGRIDIAGKVVAAEGRNFVAPRKRRIGFVFQDLALWPHLTVAGNLNFVLGSLGVPRRKRGEKMDRALAMVRLTNRSHSYPSALSGGEQQRAALARALVAEPRLLLLDEPLTNLDVYLKAELQAEILKIQQQLNITTLYITHDPNEAFFLGERIAILQAGQLVQVGSGEQLLEHPGSDFVTRLISFWNAPRSKHQRKK